MLRSGFEYEVFGAGLGLVAGLVGVEDELGRQLDELYEGVEDSPYRTHLEDGSVKD